MLMASMDEVWCSSVIPFVIVLCRIVFGLLVGWVEKG